METTWGLGRTNRIYLLRTTEYRRGGGLNVRRTSDWSLFPWKWVISIGCRVWWIRTVIVRIKWLIRMSMILRAVHSRPREWYGFLKKGCWELHGYRRQQVRDDSAEADENEKRRETYSYLFDMLVRPVPFFLMSSNTLEAASALSDWDCCKGLCSLENE